MIRKLGGLFSSSELGGHTYCSVVLVHCSPYGVLMAGRKKRRKKKRRRKKKITIKGVKK